MQYPATHIGTKSLFDRIARRAWASRFVGGARGVAICTLLLTAESGFMPHLAPALPPLTIETPFQETRVELLRALDKYAGKRLSELDRVMLCDIIAEVA